MRRGVVRIAAIVAGTALIAGCATSPAPPISATALAGARSFNLFTVYWAGPRVDGIALTQADGLGDYVPPIGVSMYYGNCLHQSVLKLGGCTLPLKITTVLYVPHSNRSLGQRRWIRLHGVPALIFNHGDEAELYTDMMEVDVIGATPKLTLDGARKLTTFNRSPTAAWPAFPPPQYTPGVSLRQLAARNAGASGASGTVNPPGDLQPSVTPSR